MTLTDSIKTCFRKFVTFSGRASRSEYWWFFLFTLIVGAAISVIDGLIFGPQTSFTEFTSIDLEGIQSTGNITEISYGNGPLGNLWGLAVFLPSLAVGWRRMHDTDRPGWFLFLPLLVIIVGALVLLTFMGVFSGVAPTAMGALDAFKSIGAALFIMFWLLGFSSIVAVVVFLCKASQPWPNRYGRNPNEVPQ